MQFFSLFLFAFFIEASPVTLNNVRVETENALNSIHSNFITKIQPLTEYHEILPITLEFRSKLKTQSSELSKSRFNKELHKLYFSSRRHATGNDQIQELAHSLRSLNGQLRKLKGSLSTTYKEQERIMEKIQVRELLLASFKKQATLKELVARSGKEKVVKSRGEVVEEVKVLVDKLSTLKSQKAVKNVRGAIIARMTAVLGREPAVIGSREFKMEMEMAAV